MKKALLAGAISLAALFPAIPASPVKAADPVPVVTCDASTVAVGQTLHCAITGTDGQPTNNVVKWRNPRTGATMNVAQYGLGLTVNVVPYLGEAGRTETLVADLVIQNTANHLVRHSVGYASFTVSP